MERSNPLEIYQELAVATVPSKSSVKATCLKYSSRDQMMDNPVLAADNHCGLRQHGPTGRFLTSPYAASLLSQDADTRTV